MLMTMIWIESLFPFFFFALTATFPNNLVFCVIGLQANKIKTKNKIIVLFLYFIINN